MSSFCCCLSTATPSTTPQEQPTKAIDTKGITTVEAIPVAEVVEEVQDYSNDPDKFYAQFNYVFNKPSSEEDIRLLSREELETDRILDLLLIMDCTSSMSSWLELCKRTLTYSWFPLRNSSSV